MSTLHAVAALLTAPTDSGAGGGDTTGFGAVLRGFLVYIVLPVSAVACVAAFWSGKVGKALLGLGGTVLGLAVAFGGASTWSGIGTWAAGAIDAIRKLSA